MKTGVLLPGLLGSTVMAIALNSNGHRILTPVTSCLYIVT